MDALAFLDRTTKGPPQPVYIVTGDETFLQRQVLTALQQRLLGDADPSFALSVYPGDKAEWSALRSELDTLPFLSPRRVVVVEAADPFVTANRAALEKYVAKPSTRGVLILQPKSWPGNTKLAKAVPDPGTIVCKAPPPFKLAGWCVQYAADIFGKSLDTNAAQFLVELVGTEMGLLAQELEKLANYVGDTPRIGKPDVDAMAGRTREAETFKIFDAVGEGNAGKALQLLARLFEQGEDPMQLLGAFSYQLRRLATVGQWLTAGKGIAGAVDSAGVPPFARAGIETQVRHLGQRRLALLLPWLLEADLGMKGNSQFSPRLVLEQLLVKIARAR